MTPDPLEGQELTFGRRIYSAEARAVWGARLIAPNDLLPDRQSLIAVDDEAKAALVAWLNGEPAGTGALKATLERLAELRLAGSSREETVIYEDERGRVVASPQGSFGYVYVAGWLL